ncbi:hypothetical protein ACFL2Q_15655 [Thermodesulfobacteriota bacterium]
MLHNNSSGQLDDSGYKEISAGREIAAEEVIEKGIHAYLQYFDTAIEEMRNQLKEILYEDTGRIANDVGNVVNAEGEEFSLEKYLEMIQKIQFDFDDEGRPLFPVHIAHPKTAAVLKNKLQEWFRDSDSRKKLETVIQAKRQEWHDREQ